MSVQSTNFVTSGLAQAGGIVAQQAATPRVSPSPEITTPKIELGPTEHATPEVVQHVLDKANKVLGQSYSDVEFVVDSTSHQVVIKLVEPVTGIVINQYPTEQAIAISNAIIQMQQQAVARHEAFKSSNVGMQGLFFNQKS